MRLMALLLTFSLTLAVTLTGGSMVTQAATAPLLPFNQTGDLYVLDNGCDCVLRISPSGAVSVAVTTAQIMAVTGGSVSFTEAGIAFDANDVMLWVTVFMMQAASARTTAGED